MTTSVIPRNSNTEFCVPDDRLYLATRAWLIFLQGLFKSRPRGQYKWSENEDETEILIFDQEATDVPPNNLRPIITTVRGSATTAGHARDGVISQDFAEENRVYADTIATSMTFNCIAREGVEAQALAYNIMMMIPVFKKSLLRLGKMHWISNNIQVTPETSHGQVYPGSSFPEWRLVRVFVPFHVMESISATVGFHNMLQEVTLHMEESA